MSGMGMDWIGPMIQAINDSVQNNKNMSWQWFQNIWNRKHFKRDRALAWQREDTFFQRAVADAQAAGLHPYFALGGRAGGGSAPIIGTDQVAPQSRGGSGALADMFKGMTGREQEMHEAQLKAIEAQTRHQELLNQDLVAKMADDAAKAKLANKSMAANDVKIVPGQAKQYDLPLRSNSNWSLFNKTGQWRTGKSATAQQVEDEYGDTITDLVYAPYRAVTDWFWYNEGWRYLVPKAALVDLESERNK